MKQVIKITSLILLLILSLNTFQSCTKNNNPKITRPSDLYQNAVTSIVTLDAKAKERLESDYKKQYGDSLFLNEYTKQPGKPLLGAFCYGEFENCTVIFMPTDLAIVTEITVADQAFSYGSSVVLYGYHNGTFYELADAFDNGYISEDDVAKAAQRHNNISSYNSTL